MTRADAMLLAALAAFALAAYPVAAALAGDAASSTAILAGPYGETRIDLDVDALITVEGRGGPVRFEVEDGLIRVVDATCPDGVCVRSGVLAAGAPIVCAPNGVFARMADGRGGDLDAISR